MEIQYVKNTYEIIAEHFSSTRNNVWGKVAEYMNQLPENSYIADIGCGNGKNMFRKDELSGSFFSIMDGFKLS